VSHCRSTLPAYELSANDWKGQWLHSSVQISISYRDTMSRERRTKLFGKLHQQANNLVSDLKFHTEEAMRQFSTGPINRTVPGFRKRLTKYVNAVGDILSIYYFEDLLLTNTFTLTVFALS